MFSVLLVVCFDRIRPYLGIAGRCLPAYFLEFCILRQAGNSVAEPYRVLTMAVPMFYVLTDLWPELYTL